MLEIDPEDLGSMAIKRVGFQIEVSMVWAQDA
jgi:hypothetical protein